MKGYRPELGNGGNPCKQVAHLLTTGGLNGAVFRLASRIE
jgi:hypothetical protein